MPADHAGGDLVAQREGEHRGMVAKLGHLLDQLPPDGLLQRPFVEERDVLRPRQADHDPQPLGGRRIEQLAPGRRIRSDRVDAEAGHLPEVGGDLLQRGELIPLCVGRKCPVGDALDEEAFIAGAQKFPVRDDARG